MRWCEIGNKNRMQSRGPKTNKVIRCEMETVGAASVRVDPPDAVAGKQML